MGAEFLRGLGWVATLLAFAVASTGAVPGEVDGGRPEVQPSAAGNGVECRRCDCECEPVGEPCILYCESCTCASCTQGWDCLRTNRCDIFEIWSRREYCGYSCSIESSTFCEEGLASLALDGTVAERASYYLEETVGFTTFRRTCDGGIMFRMVPAENRDQLVAATQVLTI